MAEPLSRVITEPEIQSFARDGAICLRGLFSVEWVERLNAGIERLRKNPGPLGEVYFGAADGDASEDPERAAALGPGVLDVVIALSYSGETDELLPILQSVKTLGARLIALTGDPTSALGKAADVMLDCSVSEEACPLGLAPTASTTAALALGDALAMSVLVAKGFKLEDFAKLHPGGRLGRQLMRVEQLMHHGDAIPCVSLSTPMPDVIHEMNNKRLGMTCEALDALKKDGIV